MVSILEWVSILNFNNIVLLFKIRRLEIFILRLKVGHLTRCLADFHRVLLPLILNSFKAYFRYLENTLCV